MTVTVIPNMTRSAAYEVTSAVLDKLAQLGCPVWMDPSLEERFGTRVGVTYTPTDSALPACDIVLSVGGDGSFINAAKLASVHGKPLLCVNAGKLAYLAAIESDELDLLQKLATGDFVTEPRMMLTAAIVDENGNESFREDCVNDAVISRGAKIRVQKLCLRCNGAPLIDYLADGVIVSTPTGSTAYSLSAGGPILSPATPAFVVSVVCPHTLTSRPLVLPAESVVTVRLARAEAPAGFSVDGVLRARLRPGDTFTATTAALKVRLLSLPDADPFAPLRTKLGWRGTVLP